MITQHYFCDKCEAEIGDGQFMFKYDGFEMFRNDRGKERRLNSQYRFKWDHNKLYCIECVRAFVNMPGR